MSYVEQHTIEKLSTELSVAVAKEIITAYTQQISEFISILPDADMVTRGRIAHTLKGDSPLVGATQLTELAQTLDAEFKQKNELNDEQCAELAVLCKNTIDELDKILDTLD